MDIFIMIGIILIGGALLSILYDNYFMHEGGWKERWEKAKVMRSLYKEKREKLRLTERTVFEGKIEGIYKKNKVFGNLVFGIKKKIELTEKRIAALENYKNAKDKEDGKI